jgi:hypothetical protein
MLATYFLSQVKMRRAIARLDKQTGVPPDADNQIQTVVDQQVHSIKLGLFR